MRLLNWETKLGFTEEQGGFTFETRQFYLRDMRSYLGDEGTLNEGVLYMGDEVILPRRYDCSM